MIYKASLPLDFFDYFAVQAFFRRLRPTYKPPCRKRLLIILLDESYRSVKIEVEEYLDK
jgi:hypothetical protein